MTVTICTFGAVLMTVRSMKMRSEQRKLLAVVAGAAVAALLASGAGYVVLTSGDPASPAGPELSVRPASIVPSGAAPISAAPSAVAPPPTAGVTTGPPRATKPAPVITTTKSAPDAGPAIIRWIRKFTPTGGGQGGLSNIYTLFMQRDCAAGAFNCWHGQVYTIFKELVVAHRGQRPTSVDSGEPLAAGCPEITGLQPDHGPRSGGYTVTVSGRNLPPELDLLWRDINVTVTVRRAAAGAATMTVPAAGPEASPDVVIAIADAPSLDPHNLTTFRYDD
ncbi:IPT/TIG domain-containing protein [Dactylosporangium sp. NPDC051541]|uniref:IPT/TIG domain-containing protein n=1 Tax=Dactylosporangium sp. NPDC051541 TaxID=3363977 RepID=UPI00378ACBC9